MARFTLLNCRQFVGGVDLTTVSNKVDFEVEIEEKDATMFAASGDVWKEVIGGIKSAQWSSEGAWEAADASKVDNGMWAGLGTSSALTVCPATAAVGSVAWVTGALRTQYQLGGAVGDLAPWSAEGRTLWPVARGVVLHDPGTPRTTTGTGTSVLHVAASSSQYVYGALHVVGFSGTGTITVRIEADTATGFPSATTVATFTAASAVGGEAIRVAGPLTDTWYRAAWTVTGTPSALFVASVGIA